MFLVMKKLIYFSLVYFLFNFNKCLSQDISAAINTKKFLNIVDDKFISIVVDPMLLMNGLQIDSRSLLLAKHFSPGFVRFQGTTTPQISYADERTKQYGRMNLAVTPSMWTSLNEWLINANLTPVFALSDRDRINDTWNSKSIALPLMTIADKINVTCFWELNNDLPNKSLKQYADDVTILRHILDAFPGRRNSWHITGGELGQYPLAPITAENIETTRKLLKTIEDAVDAIIWNPILTNKNEYPAKLINGITTNFKKGPAVWTIAPITTNPTSFNDALIWAKHLGQAACRGYDVIFRQPKVKEFFELTPAYWISLFHKSLMGRNVLDTRHYNNKNDCYIFAHCSKCESSKKNAGITIFIVNMGNEEVNINVKLLGINIKNLEIKSYIFTSNEEESSNIYLNGNLLSIFDLENYPKSIKMSNSNQIKSSKSVILNLPSKSVGFFVIPSAELPACFNNISTFKVPASEEVHQNENSVEKQQEILTTLNNFYKKLETEIKSNERFYKQTDEQTTENTSNEKRILSSSIKKLIREKAAQLTKEKFNNKNQPIEMEQVINDFINNNNEETENEERSKRSALETHENLKRKKKSIDLVNHSGETQQSSCMCKKNGLCCNCGKQQFTKIAQKMMKQLENIDATKKNTESSSEMSEMKSLMIEIKNLLTTMQTTKENKPEIKPPKPEEKPIPKIFQETNENTKQKEKREIRIRRLQERLRAKRNIKLRDESSENDLKSTKIIPPKKLCTLNDIKLDAKKSKETTIKELREKLEYHNNLKIKMKEYMTRLIQTDQEIKKQIQQITNNNLEQTNNIKKRAITTFDIIIPKLRNKSILETKDDETKESDFYLNEIPKETNNFPFLSKENDDSPYKIKLDFNGKFNHFNKETELKQSSTTVENNFTDNKNTLETTTMQQTNGSTSGPVMQQEKETGLVLMCKKVIEFLQGIHEKLINYMIYLAR